MASEQLQAILEGLKRPDWAGLSLEEQRTRQRELGPLVPLADDIAVDVVTAGGVPAEWVIPPYVSGARVVQYLHGGSYVLGSPATHRELVSRIARASGARTLSVDYRLAPEDPFPAAVQDALAAYRWLLTTGVDPADLVVAGDSSGGGLAIATLLALRDAAEPLPAAVVCLSPWVDLAVTGESIVSNADGDPEADREHRLQLARTYAGDADLRAPLVSPLYGDLQGLPPMLVQAGGAEALLDDSKRLAERAQAAGVDVTLEVWDEMIHVWQAFAFMLPEGQQAIDRIGEFVRARTRAGANAQATQR